MNKYAEMACQHGSDYQDAGPLMQYMANAARSFEQAWQELSMAASHIRGELPEEYGTLASAELETWKVWQAFERTCAQIDEIRHKVRYWLDQEQQATEKEKE